MKFISLPLLLLGLIIPVHANLRVSFTSSGKSTTKQVAVPALFVGENESPAPGLPAGPFHACYTGKLTIPKRFRVSFSVESKGKVQLKINEEEIALTDGKSDRIRLNPGGIPI